MAGEKRMQAIVFDRKTACSLTPAQDFAFISLTTPNRNYWNTINNVGWKDFLQLAFHDIVDPVNNDLLYIDPNTLEIPELVLFNEIMAEQLYNFIMKNKPSKFVIHCDAGISRSTAVGAHLRDFHQYDVEFKGKVPDDRNKNILVYNLLRRHYMKGYNETY